MTTAKNGSASHRIGRTTCAIVGGGPAGLVLGLLLARAGVEVTVLEKHADFLRDFRGDTVHPTTLGLLDDLGLFDRFDRLPHSRVSQVVLPGPEGTEVRIADFSRLPLRHPYVAMVPQWDLLDLLADAAGTEPTFTLLTRHEVTGVIRGGGRVRGVEYISPEGSGRLFADLTVACDGRSSTVRRAVGFPTQEYPVRFDVWWYRVTTRLHLGESLLPKIDDGRAAIAIPREGYIQVASLGKKGTDAEVRARGIEAFRAQTAALLPGLAGDVATIASMDDVKHLDVRLDRLLRWHANGVLCIGDAAHAMSPVGGVGINLAVQDAVAAARLLAAPLKHGDLAGRRSGRILAGVQRRRALPTYIIQGLQRLMHSRIIEPALAGRAVRPPQGLVGFLRRLPQVTAIPAFIIGVGPRPEKAPRWARRGAPPAAADV
jgi:2-polyprenyl-6-methoxyphenol hydroxylase-like FAD-dependent oxidoreductase